jgi:Arc/MetJ-type ribon-helix-helix transcriptional regulator
MTQILTMRLDNKTLAAAEARAARLGLNRSGYVRALIEDDLKEGGKDQRHRFASDDLVGKYKGTGRPATNAEVRSRLRKKSGR